MGNKTVYKLPSPMIDEKEINSLEVLTERYNKIITPSKLNQLGTTVNEYIPNNIKELGNNIKDAITEQELFIAAMKVIADGFAIVEKTAAKSSISETTIINKINKKVTDNEITNVNEICLARSYDISKIVSKYKTGDLRLAFVEGGVTGAFGFAGLPFNLVLSTFVYYRAVQSIAMHYGYDIKNDSSELIIASEVFMKSLSPNSKGANELTDIIGKVMIFAELATVKQTVKKTWTDMAARGGVCLFVVQMRALANNAAKKALEKAGQKGLEKSVFKGIFEQIGKTLTKKTVSRSIPVIGGIIGALFDTAQMNAVLEYADIFYNKRYLIEKDIRVNQLINPNADNTIIDILDFDE